MPDRYGFDHLGDEVRCIEDGCGAGGPRYAWTEMARALHYRDHVQEHIERLARENRERLAVYRALVAHERTLKRKAGHAR